MCGGETVSCRILVGRNLRERKNLKDLGVDGMIVLNGICGKYGGKA
jgi:hypothetical protein